MTSVYHPPLSIHFIWNPSDNENVLPLLDILRIALARDKDSPFSRELNIPLFFYSTQNNNQTPLTPHRFLAKKNIVFIFTSTNTLGRANWQQYIEGLEINDSVSIIPVAIDRSGLNHKGKLDKLNCIRFYSFPKGQQANQLALVYITHEIFRQSFSGIKEGEPGKSSSIKLFLSHAKAGDTGRQFSESIKSFIDNTNMNHFFDSTEISPGFNFEQEIEKHLPTSTLLIFETDAYSSRYWCQREVLFAKKTNRPIIVVNCLEKYVDRIFPAVSNIPCLHIDSNKSLSDEDILRILSCSLLETIRNNYAIEKLESFQEQGWIPNDCQISSRPPEIRQVLEWKKAGASKICYPEPPIYPDEADWICNLGFDAFTPLWNSRDSELLKDQHIGISISDFELDGFQENHIHPETLTLLAQDIARHLLSRSAYLIYGGDLRQNGFTEFILDEAMVLQDRLKINTPPIQNHLAWPLYISEKEVVAWRAKYSSVMKTEEHFPPSDVIDGLDTQVTLPPTCPENLYIWSRCLTEMRIKSIQISNARICVGGRLTNFKGKMPGVLEEFLIALEFKKPIFLLGGFGGVVHQIVNTITTGKISEELTESWQVAHTSGYRDLQDIARSKGNHADYEAIYQILEKVSIADLAAQSGLDVAEYLSLANSYFPDECIHLILKGLRNLKL